MSVRHIGLVLDHLEAEPITKLIALVLADHADSDGVCWPSQRRIAERCCVAKRTVRKHIAILIDAGVLTKVRSGSVVTQHGERVRVTNAYRINPAVLEERPSLLKSPPEQPWQLRLDEL